MSNFEIKKGFITVLHNPDKNWSVINPYWQSAMKKYLRKRMEILLNEEHPHIAVITGGISESLLIFCMMGQPSPEEFGDPDMYTFYQLPDETDQQMFERVAVAIS